MQMAGDPGSVGAADARAGVGKITAASASHSALLIMIAVEGLSRVIG